MARARRAGDDRSDGVPRFFLYGEAPGAEPAGRFLHVERLAERSLPAGWTIRPHAHPALAQLFSITRGGGTMQVDGAAVPVAAPCLMIVPPGTIHGFAWTPDVAGSVLTISASSLASLLPDGGLPEHAPELARVFQGSARSAPLRPGDQRQLERLLRRLSYELAWHEAGQGAAIDALLTLVAVLALRATDDGASATVGADAALVARFRTLIERHFRARLPVAAYAGRLCISERRLRAACARVARRTPLQLIRDRTMLEARRLLIASNRTSSDIALALGFEDPAYFSRVFHASAGQSARDFRRAGDRPAEPGEGGGA